MCVKPNSLPGGGGDGDCVSVCVCVCLLTQTLLFKSIWLCLFVERIMPNAAGKVPTKVI